MSDEIPSGDERSLLLRRLNLLIKKTKSADGLSLGGYWVGDTAGKRVADDDFAAGRLYWTAAHRCARAGVGALEAGDLETARLQAWQATDHYVAALETRVRPSDLAMLRKPARRRGRPGKK